MKERVGEIIEELRDIESYHNLKISDEVLFVQALTNYRGELASGTSQRSVQFKPKSSATIVPPTDKQIYFLKKNLSGLAEMGIDISEIKTKVEASKVIESLKEESAI